MPESASNPQQVLPPHLRLAPVSGPSLAPIEVCEHTCTLGRSLDCDVRLSHQNISRQHARLASRAGRWRLTDCGSRHGTYLNSVRLQPAEPAQVAHGDLIRIDPWTFRVLLAGNENADTDLIDTIDDADSRDARVETIDEAALSTLARHRLDLLIECTGQLNAATDEASLSEIVLNSALAGTGFGRAAILRPANTAGTVEVLAFQRSDGGTREFSFSRSLIERAATSGTMLRMTTPMETDISQSIVDLRIQSALCVPIEVGRVVSAYLYLDARGRETEVAADAAPFCQALGKLAGLALADLKRDELQLRHRELENELRAARHAQQLILPPPTGVVGGLRFALRMKPGQFVAGDLFDVVAMRESQIAVCIGDVTGEGVGAGILMASAQSHLEATLADHDDPAEVIRRLNRWVVDHSPADRFISLWLGVFDRQTDVLRYVDAGHGHWLVISEDGEMSTGQRELAGIPLGIDRDFPYAAAEVSFRDLQRIILYSDGLIEQRLLNGEQFSLDRVHTILRTSSDVETDVNAVFDALIDAAGTQSLDDDTTIASLAWVTA